MPERVVFGQAARTSLVWALVQISCGVASRSLGGAIAVLLGWVGRRANLAVMSTVLVVHLGALAAVVNSVTSSGLLVVARKLAHSEEQVGCRCESEVFEAALSVIKRDVINLGASWIVHVGFYPVSSFLQINPHHL